MANDVRSAFQQAWPMGPSSNPAQPNKADIWNAGSVIDSLLAQILSQLGLAIQWKTAVRAVATANVSVASLTNGASFQGLTLATGDRIALVGQSGASGNGIYVVQASGGAVRASDADTGGEMLAAAFYASAGDNAGKAYLCITPPTITLDSTGLSFVLISDTSSLNAALASLQSLASREVVASGPIVEDIANRLGGGNAVYIPLVIGVPGIFSKTLAPADSKLGGYFKVSVNNIGNTISIYYDRQADVVLVAQAPTNMPSDAARYFHIATFSGNDRGATSVNKVVSTSLRNVAAVAVERAIVYDLPDNTLSIPTVYGVTPSGAVWQLSPLNAGEIYRDIVIDRSPASTPFQLVWIDVADIVKNGSTSPNALRVTNDFNPATNPIPANDGWAVLVGIVFTEQFVSFDPFGRVARTVANMNGAGRDDSDLADYVYGSAAPVALSSAFAASLGFTRGWVNADAGQNYDTFVGGFFDQPLNAGQGFARFYVETTMEGDFGTLHRGYALRKNADGSITPVDLRGAFQKTRQLSVNLAEYTGRFYLPANSPNSDVFVGASFGFRGAASGQRRLCGVQFTCGAETDPYISRRDYPRKANQIGSRVRALEASTADPSTLFLPLIPSKLYVMDSRPYPIYFNQMFDQNRIAGRASVVVTRAAADSSHAPVLALQDLSVDGIELPLSRLAASETLNIDFVDKQGRSDTRIGRAVTVKKVSEAQIDALNFKVLTLGDSLSDQYGTAVQIINRLIALGASVNSIGTLQMAGAIAGEAPQQGEARAGYKFADFTYVYSASTTPLPAGQESAYLGWSESVKRTYMPFLKVPSSDDTANRPDMVKNGYIFDPAFYVSRFSLPTPDLFLINLYTNDLSQYATYAQARDAVLESARIVIAQIRRQFPAAKIVLVGNSLGHGTYGTGLTGDARWTGAHVPLLRALMGYLRSINDAAVYFLPAYCAVSRDTGFPVTEGLADANGLINRVQNDAIHPSSQGVLQFGEFGAQAIGGFMVGI